LVISVICFISAIFLSIISAIFSVSGIRIIFSGAILGATVMGIAMELGKISTTLWLYKYWHKTVTILKVYLLLAVTILVLISSTGIYGFLAKAYVGQTTDIIHIQNEINNIDLIIENENKNIERLSKTLNLLDASIDKYIDLGVVTKGLEQRTSQSAERQSIQLSMSQSYTEINECELKKLELKNSITTLNTNVGPIKYIAILIYGEENAESMYDNAARIFIILLVLVFDPLAVLLMVAGNISLEEYLKSKSKKIVNPKKMSNKTNPSKTTKRRKVVQDTIHTEKTITTMPKEQQKKVEKVIPKIDYDNPQVKKKPINQELPPKIHKKRTIAK